MQQFAVFATLSRYAAFVRCIDAFTYYCCSNLSKVVTRERRWLTLRTSPPGFLEVFKKEWLVLLLSFYNFFFASSSPDTPHAAATRGRIRPLFWNMLATLWIKVSVVWVVFAENPLPLRQTLVKVQNKQRQRTHYVRAAVVLIDSSRVINFNEKNTGFWFFFSVLSGFLLMLGPNRTQADCFCVCVCFDPACAGSEGYS
jgi:hypothetical protein